MVCSTNLIQGSRQAFHDIRPLFVEIVFFKRVHLQVVELPCRAAFHLLDDGRLGESARS